MTLDLWNNPVTAERYRLFTEKHDRYRVAARELAEAVGIAPGQRVLDVAGGIGCTALACLEKLGPEDKVSAVEAAGAMRQIGRDRTDGLPVDWRAEMPVGELFDRVVCGAAVWALGPFEAVIEDLAAHVAPGGVLAISLPAAYLGEADQPGGGEDPWLTALPQMLAQMDLGAPPSRASEDGAPVLSDGLVRRAFAARGFTVTRSDFRQRLTQAAYCDWMSLPPVNATLLGKLSPQDRPAAVARAAMGLDAASWRWEAWAVYAGTRKASKDHRV
ncbi:methyltransferase domain-containing protein [Roseibium sp. M-1]